MIQNRIQPIEDSKKTVTSMVQERVRQAILDSVLEAGSRIDQNQLATDLNVSLVPVREALKKLEGEGFVQIVPRRGAFVTSATVEDMEDLYFTRQILEGQAAYHAATQITEEQIAKLESLMEKMDIALNHHDFDSFMRLNREFHFVIYDASGSRYLPNIIASLWELSERYRYRYMFIKDQGAAIQKEHQVITQACREHDSKVLRDAILHHMQQTLTGIRGYIERERR